MEISLQELLGRFLEEHGEEVNTRLIHLWENWDMVMGEELAPICYPLGHKDRTLIVGAEDNMMQQELSYYAFEILERVNAFVNEEYFNKVRVELLMGKAPMDVVSLPKAKDSGPEPLRRPKNLGKLVGKLNPESPVTKAYEKYVKMFDELD